MSLPRRVLLIILRGPCRIVGPLNVAALRRAYQSLVDRHPSLRTTFIALERKAVSTYSFQDGDLLSEQDASAWSETRLSERLIEEAEQPFDLEEGPLLRLSIFRRTKQEHILLLTVHHLIADFWSLAMLLRETTALYRMETEGVEANLPPLTWQYADHVQWQEQALSGRRARECVPTGRQNCPANFRSLLFQPIIRDHQFKPIAEPSMLYGLMQS